MSLPVKPEHLETQREWRRRSVQRQIDRRRVQLDTRVEGQRTTIRRTPVKPVSAKRATEKRIYDKRRPLFLEGKVCARCGTTQRLTVHHMAGRVGDAFLDESRWLPLCVTDHRWVTEHPREAVEQGYSLPRIGRAA